MKPCGLCRADDPCCPCGSFYAPKLAGELVLSSVLLPSTAATPSATSPGVLELEELQKVVLPRPSAVGPADPLLPLPKPTIHQLGVDGMPPEECVRGFRQSVCPHHQGKSTPRVEVCGRQDCEASYKANTIERAKDCWDGTADVEADRLGLRHFGSIAWGVFVFTTPDVLWTYCTGKRLQKFNQASARMVFRILQRQAGDDAARFYAKSWLHPVGELDDDQGEPDYAAELPQERSTIYKPHANYIVPLRAFIPHRPSSPTKDLHWMLAGDWMGKDGWVSEAWREELVAIFGQWWPSSEEPPPATNWYYKFLKDDRTKGHALKYFGRVFPGWSGHRQVKSIRPRSLQLSHWKQKDDLRTTVAKLEPLPPWGTCPSCVSEKRKAPPKVAGFGTTALEATQALTRGLLMHLCSDCPPPAAAASAERPAAASYAQLRRIMVSATWPAAPPDY